MIQDVATTSASLDRTALFWEPCQSREELQEHIRTFLKIDLPDRSVDDNSNSSAMDFVWVVYQIMLTGKGPTKHVVAAARNTAKTLTASIVRFYGMVHFRRDGTHLAANLEQSNSASVYLDKFLRIQEVIGYVKVNNSRTKELDGMPANFHTDRPNAVLRITVATPAGVNSQRGSLNIKDEVDLLKREILSEAAWIADPTGDRHQFAPIEILLSSRKSKDGPIQDELDAIEKGNKPNLMAHRWSLVDWMKSCPVETRGSIPTPAWINTETLEVSWDAKRVEKMEPAEREQQRQIDVFDKCKACPALIMCQGRSAKQTGQSRMLRSIEFVSSVIDQVKSADKLIAQGLNWKPESSGNVFRMLRRDRHYLRADRAWRWLFGRPFIPEGMTPEQVDELSRSIESDDIVKIKPTKKQIYDQLVNDGWMIHYGVDWGFSPAEATCICAAYHRKTRRVFFFHVAASQHYANHDWAAFIAADIWPLFPGDVVCPDMEDPSSPTYFVKHRIPSLDTKPSRIEPGVSQIRSLLWNPKTQRSHMAILDDDQEGGQNGRLFEAMGRWSFQKTAIGFNFNKFEDDHNCDYCDPSRYLLAPFIDEIESFMNVDQPIPQDQIALAAAQGDPDATKIVEEKNKLHNQINEHWMREYGIPNVMAQKKPEPIKKKVEGKQKRTGPKFIFD